MKRPMPNDGKKSARKAPVSASRSQATNEWMRGMRLNTYTITLLAMIVLGVLTLAPRVQEWFVLRLSLIHISEPTRPY